MRHPSTAYSFALLRDELDRRIADGSVRRETAADAPEIVLYCYTNRAVYDNAWDPFVEMARGLVLDHAAEKILARPFPKFFNYGERNARVPDEPFEVLEKLDGSLGITFHDGRRWRVVTKGSFRSEQSAWAERWLQTRDLSHLNVGTTYLFEIIYPENRIVVHYPFEGLVLLGAYNAEGWELSRSDLASIAEALGARLCGAQSYASMREILDAVGGFDATQEGFVVRFESGYRVKIKGSEYLRIHRLISRVTPLALWEAWAAGDSLDAIRREIPEEFWGDFDQIRGLLQAQHLALIQAVETGAEPYQSLSDKELGLARATLPELLRTFLFTYRKGGPQWFEAPKARDSIFRQIRPTGNALDGYVPSEGIVRMQSDDG